MVTRTTAVSRPASSRLAIPLALLCAASVGADPLNPLDFPSLGTVSLPANVTPYILNTTTLQLTGPGGFSTLAGSVSSEGIAVFSFDVLTIPSGASLKVQGSRPAALLASGTITIAGTINANGGDGSNGAASAGTAGTAGPGASPGGAGGTVSGAGHNGSGLGAGSGGSSQHGGAGAGFGGVGGTAQSVATGAGPVNGVDPILTLSGGSGAGGEGGFPGGGLGSPSSAGGAGGGGGGALEIGSLGTVVLTGSTITANGGDGGNDTNGGGLGISAGSGGGGSGGAILIHGSSILLGSLQAAGGAGSGTTAKGGGGGGGRISFQAVFNPGASGVSVAGGSGGHAGSAGVISFVAGLIESSNLDFGNVNVGATKSMDLTIQNVGDPNSALNGMFPAAAAPFARVGAGVFSDVQSGQSRINSYSFHPVAAGPFSQQLTFLSDGGPATVVLQGNGVLACPADLNHDGLVDDADFSIFVVAYEILDCADAGMPPGCPADLNANGFVDDADFSIFVVTYNDLVCP